MQQMLFVRKQSDSNRCYLCESKAVKGDGMNENKASGQNNVKLKMIIFHFTDN